jgi:microcystin-dependent protein
MNRILIQTSFAVVLQSVFAISAFGQSPYASLQVPKQIQYQGRVATGTGGAWSGTEGYFVFALLSGPPGSETVLWNNWNGNSSPAALGAAYTSPGSAQVLTLPVSQGVFSVRLGDPAVNIDANKEIPTTVFFDTVSNSVRNGMKLAVWFSADGGTFTRLSPDVEFASVPFAMVSGIAEAVKERAVSTAMLADESVTLAKIEAGWGTVPPGTIIPYGIPGSTLPAGYVECNGTEVNSADYPRLASLLGQGATSAYGSAAAGKIRLPDLRGRVPMGQGQGVGLTNRVLAQSPGSLENQVLNANHIPAHTHSGTTDAGNSAVYRVVHQAGSGIGPGHVTGYASGAYTDRNDNGWPLQHHTHNFTTNGGNGLNVTPSAFSIMQPSLVVRYLMKY